MMLNSMLKLLLAPSEMIKLIICFSVLLSKSCFISQMVDRFILKAELLMWLAKLEGQCNAIDVPAVRNFGHNCIATLVLHSSIQSLTLDLIGEIHDRLRENDSCKVVAWLSMGYLSSSSAWNDVLSSGKHMHDFKGFSQFLLFVFSRSSHYQHSP
ncbi:hypothetical protein Patl1_33460 [Pistacia atlantica]|uniref:Uncharacterized protein n=1 Tax=Pistacia atlantica TaxID=434234 RepID=A0ACC0ZSZ4_9ROSI|nr:hypothetical protein Patl1_33460 [Pistacia atlantica]